MSWKATAIVAEIIDNITRSEKLLLMCLSNRHNDDEGCAWASISRLAKESLMSERTAYRALDTLFAKGFVEIGERKGKSSIYVINGLPDIGRTSDKLAEVETWKTRRTPDEIEATPDKDERAVSGVPLTQLRQITPDIAMSDEPSENRQCKPSANRERAPNVDSSSFTVEAERFATVLAAQTKALEIMPPMRVELEAEAVLVKMRARDLSDRLSTALGAAAKACGRKLRLDLEGAA